MRKDYNSRKREDWIDPPRNGYRKDYNAGKKTSQPYKGYKGPNKPKQQNDDFKANIGWLFYRDYYRGLETGNANLSEKNKFITSSEFKSFKTANEKKISEALTGFSCVEMEVLPPGLLIGSGISHGIPGAEDFQLGFQFDYTTGLPVIPGSSVKGVLRSMFPMKGESDKTDYIKSLLPGWNDDKIKKLGEILFNHDDLATSETPVFFDAIVSRGVEKKQQNKDPKSQDKKGDILGSDYITPHGENPLKSPKPIQFMKVLPGVRFKFYFKLPKKLQGLTSSDLRSLFIKILEDVGVGAKTNVGYGHLKHIE
ncbi:MAG: type III-B CRISPR module RAMP protein Cmr6 [Muribaculaceae bacterium]|nr:type III-B CRISPR module RAMP protein Cmr6 [Muribaculaceae bacterium]